MIRFLSTISFLNSLSFKTSFTRFVLYLIKDNNLLSNLYNSNLSVLNESEKIRLIPKVETLSEVIVRGNLKKIFQIEQLLYLGLIATLLEMA